MEDRRSKSDCDVDVALANTRLFRQAERHGEKLFECAYELERHGYDVVHVDKAAETGVLLEAHDESKDGWEGAKIFQITGGACHFDGIAYNSISAVCAELLDQLDVTPSA